MSDNYTKQLRNDSAFYILPATFVFFLLAAIAIFALYSDQRDNFSYVIAYVVISVAICLTSNRFIKQKRELAGYYLLIFGHSALLWGMFIRFGGPNSLIPFLFAYFIIISSALIEPKFCFNTWAISSLSLYLGLWIRGDLNWMTGLQLLIPIILNLFLGIATFTSTVEWQEAVTWATMLREKASRRRDELYNTQAELRLVNDKQQFLNKQLATSFAVAHQITSILTLEVLLQEVTDLIAEQFKYGYVAIFLPDKSLSVLEVQAQAGIAITEELVRSSLSIEHPCTISQAAMQLKVMRVNDVTAQNYHHHPYLWVNARSELSLPLLMGKDKLLGVLHLQSSHTAVFDDDIVSMLQSLADQVTISIQNADLYHREEVRRQLSDRLNEIGRALSSTLNRDEVLNLILDNLATLVQYDRASVLLYRGDYLEIVAAKGFAGDLDMATVQIELGESPDDVFRWIHENKQSLAVPDVEKHGSWQKVGTLETRSWLGVPLARNEKVIGMLSLAREVLRPYDEDEVTLTTTFAAQAAVALQNARLYNRIARFNSELEEKVQERTEELNRAYDQLKQMDRAKTDFIEIASHELRTPLTVLRGYSDILLYDQKIKENKHHHELVSGIRKGAIRMHEIVNDMLDMAKIDDHNLKLYPEPIKLQFVVSPVVEKLTTAVADRNQTIHVEHIKELPPIVVDPDLLQKVLYQLLINAIKYTPDGGRITISGREQAAQDGWPDGLVVTVADTGIGIDAHHQELIFDKFFQTGKVSLHSSGKTKFKGGGPGLGLAIARGIIDVHHGRIWVESEGHDETAYPGSQFHVFLPLTQPEIAAD